MGLKGIILIYLFLFINCVVGDNSNPNWNTLYSFTEGKIYLHLKNNDLVSLNFSISGFQSQSQSEVSDINLLNNQVVDTLPSPPVNSTLFMFQEELYGLTSNTSSIGNNIDACGNGLIQFIKFENNQWNNINEVIDFSAVNDGSYYEYPTILNSPLDNSTIYIYGGICSQDNVVSSRLISFDFEQLLVSNITTTTKPQPFYGAANLIAPNPQTQLVIGGQSNQGWLNMYQLATWNFNSGWSFEQVDTDNTGNVVNSRKFPLALPIFNQLNNNSINTFSNYFQVNEVLLIGGELLTGDSTPLFAKLITNSNDWVWNTTINVTLNYDEILGAATIFNTLVVINSTTTSTTTKTKRDDSSSGQYTISLYDTTSFTPITNLKTNTVASSPTSSSKTSGSSNKTTKIIIGVLVPIIVLLIVACVVFFVLRKRRQREDDEDLNTLNYSIPSPFFGGGPGPGMNGGTDHESMFTNEKGRRRKSSIDSNSTLDAASFDSWMRKREEFDRQQHNQQSKVNVRNSYLASNETLDGNDIASNEEIHVNSLPTTTPNPSHTNSMTKTTVSKLRKSLSFTNNNGSTTTLDKASSFPSLITRSNTGSGEYMKLKKKKSNSKLMSLRLTSSEHLIPTNQHHEITDEMDEVDLSEVPEEDYESSNGPVYKQTPNNNNNINNSYQDVRSIASHESDSSAYNKMDVQVLVSSKRRSILRVTNPDASTYDHIPEEEEEEDIQHQPVNPFGDSAVEIRQRVPSGSSLSDNEDDEIDETKS